MRQRVTQENKTISEKSSHSEMQNPTDNVEASPSVTMEKDLPMKVLSLFLLMPLLIGTGVALAIHNFGDTDAYLSKISSIAENETVWLYLGLVVFGRTVTWLNIYPTAKFKNGMKGNIRANPFIYKVLSLTGKDAEAYKDLVVVYDEDGSNGKYNRANRSVQHMTENFGLLIASLYAVGIVYPFPTFILICVFCVGRIMHQIGYTNKYGSHGAGFGLAMLAASIVEGLCVVIAMNAF